MYYNRLGGSGPVAADGQEHTRTVDAAITLRRDKAADTEAVGHRSDDSGVLADLLNKQRHAKLLDLMNGV